MFLFSLIFLRNCVYYSSPSSSSSSFSLCFVVLINHHHHYHHLILFPSCLLIGVITIITFGPQSDNHCNFQPYTINSAKVAFLKQRPQSRPFKGSGNFCFTCDRILQEPFHFCSLSCKVFYFFTRKPLNISAKL